jgi:hypothetical protein
MPKDGRMTSSKIEAIKQQNPVNNITQKLGWRVAWDGNAIRHAFEGGFVHTE